MNSKNGLNNGVWSVSKEGKLRGVVSRCDILRAKIEPDFVITYM